MYLLPSFNNYLMASVVPLCILPYPIILKSFSWKQFHRYLEKKDLKKFKHNHNTIIIPKLKLFLLNPVIIPNSDCLIKS